MDIIIELSRRAPSVPAPNVGLTTVSKRYYGTLVRSRVSVKLVKPRAWGELGQLVLLEERPLLQKINNTAQHPPTRIAHSTLMHEKYKRSAYNFFALPCALIVVNLSGRNHKSK